MSALVILEVASLIVAAGAQQTVTVTLDSSRDGEVVAAGATIDWAISFAVSTGDNAGLASLLVDLEQDEANPAFLDLPSADDVPTAMANFSLPNGICNPGESGSSTGYIGLQRGTAGAMNLRQIGGAQNNAGAALPAGSGIAESATVVFGVGQSGGVILASGSFSAPHIGGEYTLSLGDISATVFSQVNASPDASPAVEATTDTGNAEIVFTVLGPSIPTSSAWGMIAMAIGLLAIGTIVFERQGILQFVAATVGGRPRKRM